MQTISFASGEDHPKPLDTPQYDPFLAECDIIDVSHPAIQKRAAWLAYDCYGDEDITKACYEWVRDEIQHSVDFERGPVTCKASDVLAHGTGFCYAKSHLLAALLRACGVPAGLTYQRLKGEGGGYVLHGLNVVHLSSFGWYRLDARGNTPGIRARFSPPEERLAWSGTGDGEINFDKVWATPMAEVVAALDPRASWREVSRRLPDVTDLI